MGDVDNKNLYPNLNADAKEVKHAEPQDSVKSDPASLKARQGASASLIEAAKKAVEAAQGQVQEKSINGEAKAKGTKQRPDLSQTAAPGEIPPGPRTSAPLTFKDVFDGIQAISLTVPNFAADPHSANPNIMFRWVNFKVGDDESSLNYQQRKAQGFVNACKEDVKPDSPTLAFWNEAQKAFINYDSILMKMDRKTYLGWIKGNALRAMELGSINKVGERAEKFLREETGNKAAGKVQAFVPGMKDVEAMLGKD